MDHVLAVWKAIQGTKVCMGPDARGLEIVLSTNVANNRGAAVVITHGPKTEIGRAVERQLQGRPCQS